MSRSVPRVAALGGSLTLWIAGVVLTGVSCSGDHIARPTEPGAPTEAGPVLTTGATQALSFRQVTGAGGHTCGVTLAKRAYCWGTNTFGQLGDETTTQRLTPVPVAGRLSFLHVSAGFNHTCGVTTDGRVYCWGNNLDGQLGNGTRTDRSRPVRVAGGLRFRQVRAGGFYTCGLTTDSKAYCWGDNYAGKLGTGGGSSLSLTPVAVAGGLRFRQLDAGIHHTCGVTREYRAFCWGYQGNGQLGDGANTERHTPTEVVGGLQFRQVSAGNSHTCALTTADRAYCWGYNGQGQVGDNSSTDNRFTPVRVAGALKFSLVRAGVSHTCGQTLGGRAYCWGRNVEGQAGSGGPLSKRPVAVAGGLQFSGVEAGYLHTCGVTTGNVAYCWGWNRDGQLGDGTTTDRPTPVPVAGPM